MWLLCNEYSVNSEFVAFGISVGDKKMEEMFTCLRKQFPVPGDNLGTPVGMSMWTCE